MSTPPERSSAAIHVRRTTWAITALQVGAVFFAGGLTLLYLNPFWHFDEHGLLDWRVHWWNGAAAVMIGGGLLIAALALLALAAVLVSRCVGQRSWPYAVALLLALCPVIWIGRSGYVRNLNAGFVWDAADGFSIFSLQSWDQPTGSWRPAGQSALQSLVAMQLEPLLRGYFKLNDWQKMNGNINIKVTRIIPVVLPVTLGGEELALQDPDQTPLMRAVSAGDLNTVQQLLRDKNSVNINALDQGGETALILACESPQMKPEIIKALLAAGADVNLRSRTGYTALTWALVRHNYDVSQILRRVGARR